MTKKPIRLIHPIYELDRDAAPGDRIHTELLRRIDGCAHRRNATGMIQGTGDLEVFSREFERGLRLRSALVDHIAARDAARCRIPSPIINPHAA